jgi:hypothetical protein
LTSYRQGESGGLVISPAVLYSIATEIQAVVQKGFCCWIYIEMSRRLFDLYNGVTGSD